MAFYDNTVPYFSGALESLTNILTKAKAEGGDISKLLETRLVPDMLPLAFQVFFTADGTAKFAARVAGTEPADLGQFTDIKTFEDCEAIIAKARAALDALDKDAFEARADVVIEFGLGPNRTGKMPARGYAMGYSMPNVFFHLVTAYNILRKEGIPLGKMDYVTPWGIGKAEIITTA
jgi:hypothetical protein